MQSFFRKTWPALLLGALAVLFLGDVWFAGRMLLARDFTNGAANTNLVVGKALAGGSFLTWDSTSQCGIPFAASPFSCAFYPINWLYAICPFLLAIRLSWTLHLILAAVSCYGLARHWRLGIAPALLAAISFTFCTYCTAWLEFASGFYCMAWGVLTMLLVSVIIERTAEGLAENPESAGLRKLWRIFLRNAALIAALAVVLVLQVMISGETFYYMGMLVGAYGLARMAWHRSWKVCGLSLSWIGLAGGFALAMAMPMLLLTFEMMGFSVRSGEVEAGLNMTSAHPLHWLTLLLPYLFGRPGYPDAFWAPSIYEFANGTCYVGILPLIAIFFCWLRPKNPALDPNARQRRFLVLFFSATTLVGLLLAAGKYTPLYSYLHHWLPGLGHFRFPTKLYLYVVFSLSMLGALGLDSLLVARAKNDSKALEKLWWAAAGVFGVLLLGYILSLLSDDFLPWLMAKPTPPSPAQMEAAMSDYTSAVLFSIIGLALFGWLAFRRGPARWAQAGIVALAFINLCVISRQAQPTGPESVYQKRPEALLKRMGDNPMHRYFSTYWNANQYFYGETDLKKWAWAVDAGITNHPQLEGLSSLTPNGLPLSRYNRFFGAVMSSPAGAKMADMMSLRYIIGGAPFEQILWGNAPREVRIVERPSALPRAFVVGQWRAVSGEEAVLQTIAGDTFDPRKEAIVEPLEGETIPPSPASAVSSEQAGEVQAFADHSNSVTMDVTAKTQALLVLGDTWYPGWTVKVDGVRHPIFQANYLFRGVFLEPGAHRVEFAFRPTRLTLGLQIWAVAATLCGGLVLLSFIAGRKTLPANPQANDSGKRGGRLKTRSWSEVERLLLSGTAEEVLKLRGPRGEHLVVAFTGGAERSLSIKTKNGLIHLNLDGLSQEPAWVSVLGSGFETV